MILPILIASVILSTVAWGVPAPPPRPTMAQALASVEALHMKLTLQRTTPALQALDKSLERLQGQLWRAILTEPAPICRDIFPLSKPSPFPSMSPAMRRNEAAPHAIFGAAEAPSEARR
jgi:hypothetical protein